MKFGDLVELVGNEPAFSPTLLFAGCVDPADLRRQISRWCSAGKLVQLRRGLYALGPQYRKLEPHPFLIANHMVRGSYVSLQSALSHHGLIPEQVPVTTSVSAGRPGQWRTPLGEHLFRHLRRGLLFGFQETELWPGQRAFVAWPEKALLDLVHLTPEGDRAEYLEELRLQNLERLDLARLAGLAARAGSVKLVRAAERIAALSRREQEEYRPL